MQQRRLISTAATLTVSTVAVLGLAACEGDTSAANKANADRNKAVEKIRSKQPVEAMAYSPTLNTVNRWAEKWGQEGQVSYVYMQRADGTFAGYYVLDGLPVNYCVSGSPTYTMEDLPGDQTKEDQKVDAPALDGAYYGGCDSDRYYGFDAVTGQYIEYTDGMVLTAVLSDQPLSLDKQPRPFGSSIEDVKDR